MVTNAPNQQSFPSAQAQVVDPESGLITQAWLLFFAFIFGRVGGQAIAVPNVTTVAKMAIKSPSQGLQVFDTTLAKLCVYTGTKWETVASS